MEIELLLIHVIWKFYWFAMNETESMWNGMCTWNLSSFILNAIYEHIVWAIRRNGVASGVQRALDVYSRQNKMHCDCDVFYFDTFVM